MKKPLLENTATDTRRIVQILIFAYLIYVLSIGKYDKLFHIGLALVFTFYPYILEKLFRIKISFVVQILLNTLIFFAQFLGEVIGLYEAIYWWDDFIHTLMGGVDFVIGWNVLEKISDQKKYRLLISFMFAITVAVFWEIFEFGADRLFGTNMQTFRFPRRRRTKRHNV